MAAPPNQVPSDAAHPPAIEEQLDFVFALLPRIRDRTRWRGGPTPGKIWLESVDNDR